MVCLGGGGVEFEAGDKIVQGELPPFVVNGFEEGAVGLEISEFLRREVGGETGEEVSQAGNLEIGDTILADDGVELKIEWGGGGGGVILGSGREKGEVGTQETGGVRCRNEVETSNRLVGLARAQNCATAFKYNVLGFTELVEGVKHGFFRLVMEAEIPNRDATSAQ